MAIESLSRVCLVHVCLRDQHGGRVPSVGLKQRRGQELYTEEVHHAAAFEDRQGPVEHRDGVTVYLVLELRACHGEHCVADVFKENL